MGSLVALAAIIAQTVLGVLIVCGWAGAIWCVLTDGERT